ncbi:MAG: hypothetical protein KW804_00215 [Candidatus Doudnabacteria bacterium]|nr:hypothetical protein [Candidatus Doudnabacteria bacterium]
MNKKILVGLLLVALIIVLAVVFGQNKKDNTETPTNQTDQKNNPENNNQSNDASSQLTPGTKTYTSDKLGITFTYNPKPSGNFEVTVTEVGDKIYLHGTNEKPEQGKMIQVFTKTGSQSLAEAIKSKFLKGYSDKDCFVENIARNADDPRPDSYIFAEISYPPPSNAGDPFWQNANKCPQPYSKTNAVQYFMANTEIPTKYVFLQLGQDSITDAGTESKQDWSSSIRIIK